MLTQDYRREQEQREIRADLRAYRIVQSCRGIAIGLGGGKADEAKPADIFPSLRALKFTNDEAVSDDIDSDEDLAASSFQQLRRGLRA